eukprot:5062165-Pyramimonas_sp.AAC.1
MQYSSVARYICPKPTAPPPFSWTPAWSTKSMQSARWDLQVHAVGRSERRKKNGFDCVGIRA